MTLGTLLIGGSLLAGLLLLVEGVRQILGGTETRSEARNRRMRMLQKHAEEAPLPTTLIKAGPKEHVGALAKLQKTLTSAGSTITPVNLLVACSGSGVLASVLVWVFFGRFGWAIVAGAALFALPLMIMQVKAQRRKAAISKQMPEALDRMERGLKVGHPIGVTIESVARDMPDPIRSEFALMFDQISYGEDLPTAFRNFADRVDIEDARYLAVSVGIQHGTGGNLARVLAILAQIIRDRGAMRKKIKAISSEGRLSATILTALPLVVFAAINFSAPDIYRNLAATQYFWPFIGTIGGLIATQTLLIFKLVRFKF